MLLTHAGGPFWAKKDLGAWSIPKGLLEAGEDPLETAKREFKEELGFEPPSGEAIELGEVKQSNKVVKAWAMEGDYDTSQFRSNTTEIEWPPHSGQKIQIPEIDKAEWFGLPKAATKINKHQATFLERLAEHLNLPPPETPSEPPKQATLF